MNHFPDAWQYDYLKRSIMRPRAVLALFAFIVSVLGACAGAIAQGNPVGTPPPDPWPRVVDLANGQVLVYQPQVNKWTDNQTRVPGSARYKARQCEGGNLWRDLRQRAHAGR